MNEATRKRGRPRAYDPAAALEQARNVFWAGGFSGSSLDLLGAAMHMNRPSLFGAFGDKQALYLRTLERYRDESLVSIREALDPSRTLADGLRMLYAGALASYLAGEGGARGCLLISTAAAEALRNEAIRAVLGDSLTAFDAAFEERIRIARDDGETRADADPAMLARLVGAVLHSLAVRARAGEQRRELEALAEDGVRMICAAAGISA